MILGKIFQGGAGGSSTQTAPAPTTAKQGGGRLNLKAIPKDAPKPAAAARKAAPAAPAVKLPSFSFGGAAKKKAPAVQEVTAKVINGKLVGYFTEEQVVALVEARREIPSNAPQYWQKVRASSVVRGPSLDGCRSRGFESDINAIPPPSKPPPTDPNRLEHLPHLSQISALVPGSTPETCKAMANQLALDKARGTKKNFFGGYVEVKETEMKVDYNATPMNRIKEAFGLKK